jgi:hypothetical protein
VIGQDQFDFEENKDWVGLFFMGTVESDVLSPNSTRRAHVMNFVFRMLSLLLMALLFSTGIAGATTTITFNSLTGFSGDHFTLTSEAGFDITAITSEWREAHLFGNPVPSIFNDGLNQSVATIRVTATGGGNFSLESVDFGWGILGDGEGIGTVEGFLGGSSLFFFSTALHANDETFSTFSPVAGGFSIDSLLISINEHDSNIDNIVLGTSTVPEPSTMLLLGTGIAGLIAACRKKTA